MLRDRQATADRGAGSAEHANAGVPAGEGRTGGLAGTVVWTRLDRLLPPRDSPRLAGIDSEHVRRLVETTGTLPPIVVDRRTMRVIDGVHRVRAAEIAGVEGILVRFFDGDLMDAYLFALSSNIAHGLPLTLADRKAAAARLLELRPIWSNRAIAKQAGLDHKTVGALRRRSTGEDPQLTARLGRDGRLRRVAPDPARIAMPPGGALESVDSTAMPEPRTSQENPTDAPDDRWGSARALRADPSIRATEAGRMLLRALELHARMAPDWESIADNLPPHCHDVVTELANRCADDWQRLIRRLPRTP